VWPLQSARQRWVQIAILLCVVYRVRLAHRPEWFRMQLLCRQQAPARPSWRPGFLALL
jgi:hypothetical protein